MALCSWGLAAALGARPRGGLSAAAGLRRYARAAPPLLSEGAAAAPSAPPPPSRSLPKVFLAGAGVLGLGGLAAWEAAPLATGDRDVKSKVMFHVATSLLPVFKLLDGESAHHAAVWAAERGLTPVDSRDDPPSLKVTVFNRDFANPLGIAAGFDKDGRAIDGLMRMGFGFVEIGSITPEPQPGNPAPRVFRLPEARAVINRYGFNSEGMDAVAERLEARQGRLHKRASKGRGVLGINLGKNKASEDAAGDYSKLIKKLAGFADYLVINISSPNTPGLRALQSPAELEDLVTAVLRARGEMEWGQTFGPPALLVKIAPDLSPADLKDIAAVALKHGVDGLIVSNTTVDRPAEVAGLGHAEEGGGLSGEPLMGPSTKVLAEMYRLTKGQVVLIGAGGVSSGRDAFEKILAGATLVQLYTAMTYQGPEVVPRVKEELAACLEAAGFASVSEAVGSGHRYGRKK